MLSSNAKKMMTSCLMASMLMMLMMATTKAAAVTRAASQSNHSMRPHNQTEEAAPTFIRLQLDNSSLVPMAMMRSPETDSISPWTHDVTLDTSLIPPRLSEARCLLHGCLNAAGLEDLSLESRPIMQQVLLLRRVHAAGAKRYNYRLETRVVAVGCTCVRPLILTQQWGGGQRSKASAWR